MASFGKIEQFNGQEAEFEEYVERLEQYFEANDLGKLTLNGDGSNEGDVEARLRKRRAIFLSIIGPATYSALRNIISPSKPAEKTYEELVAVLRNRFAPTKSQTVQRYKFHLRVRREGEKIADYVADLRKTAESCNFGDSLHDMLRDRLVCGIKNEKIQNRLLVESDLTFAKAYKIAIAQETVAEEATALQDSLRPSLSVNRGLQLVITHEPAKKLFSTGNNELDEKVAYGMVLMNSGDLNGTVEHFTKVIKEHPGSASAYFGRGTAHVRKGIQDHKNAEAAIRDFSAVITHQPKNPEGWIRRAEVYSPLGRIPEALADITVALDLQPSAELYLMKGTLLFMTEDYEGASKMFEKSLEKKSNEPTAMLYLGLSFYHRGMIKQAITWYKKILKTQTNHAEVHRSLGSAYRELGDARTALEHFKAALALEPDSAPTFQLSGVLHYMNGKPKKAAKDFQSCLELDPYNAACVYMEGLCYAAIGNFYEAVKATTKIIVDEPAYLSNGITVKAQYLREYSRYLHSYLDTPLTEYSPDVDLDGRLRDHWVKSLPLNLNNYTEQPGIQPNIREVEDVSFGDLTPDAQILVCKSSTLGSLIQYNTEGFMPNTRHLRAMGLGMLDVAQVAHKHWKSIRSSKDNKNRLTWRELFDLAVKWRRFVDPDQPVLWLDKMPGKSVKAGFNVHMTLVKGQMKNIRYAEYFDKIFQFTKTMLLHFYKMDEFSTKEFKRRIEKSKTCDDLINVLKLQNPSNPQPGLMLSTHVGSLKTGGKSNLDGIILMLSEGSGQNLMFSMDTATTPSRTSSYHSELDFIWSQILNEARKPSNKDLDALGQNILSLAYYFFNLMPLSRGSSAVAYTVALGLFLAAGREATGKIPKGKEVDLEAIIGGTAEVFTKQVRGWLALKKPSKPISSYPSVQETFPTLRTSLEALNVDLTEANCREHKIKLGNAVN
ncbi:tetratricopeptide repeat protein 13-like [Actinia tenebrosa]|uniref:Tetratricopeptide repeat protein 13-like n=1 Tax=Actinia tenebrosa TaxID=6105 RepID=A0A6P8H5G9_ACTTE|nr:tetratricopeptide repeat protein 13-like [Actinia tenebrosa]